MELNFPRAPKPIQKRPLWKSAAVAVVSLAVIVIILFFWTHPSVGCNLRGGRWHYYSPTNETNGWMEPLGECFYIAK